MNDEARRTLCDLVREHGHGLVVDPRRCEGLLKDYCGEHTREIFVLVSALKERVPVDLMTAPAGVPSQALLARLAQRLCVNLALSEEAAQWAVETWALALGTAGRSDKLDPAVEPASAVAEISEYQIAKWRAYGYLEGPDQAVEDTTEDECDERKLRVMIYEALKLGPLTPEIGADLRDLSQHLKIANDAASWIFKEVRLQMMVEAGDLNGVSRLLAEDARLADATDTNPKYRTVLHRSLVSEWEIAQLLVASGANVNRRGGEWDWTALHHVSALSKPRAVGRVDRLRFLIANGANVNATWGTGYTALNNAVFNGNSEMTLLLIMSGANLHARGDRGFTALHTAAFRGALECVRILIYYGADVNAKDIDGRPPLHCAIKAEQVEIVRLLIANGSSVDAFAALFEAILLGNLEIARLLIASGVDVNTRYEDGATLLHVAGGYGQWQIAQLLLSNGADANAETTERHQTPLHYSAWSASAEFLAQTGSTVEMVCKAAQVLIDGGADVNKPDAAGMMPLYYVTNDEMAALLVEALVSRRGV